VRIAVLGLGEAGALFASDLVAAGASVAGCDPGPVPTPSGVERCAEPEQAVAGAEFAIVLTGPADVAVLFEATIGALPTGAIFADLTTSTPAAKAERAGVASERGREYVDVALMAPVPGRGLRTPAVVSGPGALAYAAGMRRLAVPIDVIDVIEGPAGEATTRKLLRSVMMKGLAAVVIEALRAADAADLSQWLWRDLVAELTAADERLLVRLVEGTGVHARRRVHEMEACAAMLDGLGVEPVMTRSTVETLRRVLATGVPEVPRQTA
jgi:3-hydroxyisobutyrate dehydrogenase-like beta-hydroxyacid dehydrogenase